MKSKLLLGSIVFSLSVLAGCGGGTQERADLDRVLDVTTKSMDAFEKSNAGKEPDMKAFTTHLATSLNAADPRPYNGPLGIVLNTDGSFEGFHDGNTNTVLDEGESKLFKLEVDPDNKRILASDGNYVREESLLGGMGMGLLAGMLLGNLMNRQRSAGVNRQSISNKQASPKRAASGASKSNNSSNSARSRAGSGSHSRGK